MYGLLLRRYTKRELYKNSMKVFKTKFSSHLPLLILDGMVLGVLCFGGIGKSDLPTDILIASTVFMVFLLVGHVLLFSRRLLISESNITETILGKWHRGLNWTDVAKVHSTCLLYPESEGILILKTKAGSKQKEFAILITSYPIEALREFLRRTPEDVPIYVYKYLQRKLDSQ